MRLTTSTFCASLIALGSLVAIDAQGLKPPAPGKTVSLFDGKTLKGWEGDTTIWSVQDGAITGGSLAQTLKVNYFLASLRDYGDFVARFQIKLVGTEGFINSGFQIRSQRQANSTEMVGYQCDYGDPE